MGAKKKQPELKTSSVSLKTYSERSRYHQSESQTQRAFQELTAEVAGSGPD